MVTAGPPGDRVCEPTTYSETEFGATVADPIVIGGRDPDIMMADVPSPPAKVELATT